MSLCSRACKPNHFGEERDVLKIHQKASHCLSKRLAQLSPSPHLVFLCFASKSVLALPGRGWAGKAEWGPFTTSFQHTAKMHLPQMVTHIFSFSFCFSLSLFSCNYSHYHLSAEPVHRKCRHCCAVCLQALVNRAVIFCHPRLGCSQRGKKSTRPVKAELLRSSCTVAP